MVRDTPQPCSTYFPIAFSKAAALKFDLDSLWFTLKIIASKSYLLIVSYIGNRGYQEPFCIMSIKSSLS